MKCMKRNPLASPLCMKRQERYMQYIKRVLEAFQHLLGNPMLVVISSKCMGNNHLLFGYTLICWPLVKLDKYFPQ